MRLLGRGIAGGRGPPWPEQLHYSDRQTKCYQDPIKTVTRPYQDHTTLAGRCHHPCATFAAGGCSIGRDGMGYWGCWRGRQGMRSRVTYCHGVGWRRQARGREAPVMAGRIRILPPPFAFGTRSERGCPPAAATPVTQGCPMFRDATPCGRAAAGDSRAPGAVPGSACRGGARKMVVAYFRIKA